MKIFVIGGGGREHALVWKIAQSPLAEKIYCAPGNAGIAELAECVDIGVMDFEKLTSFAAANQIDLTVVGMDDPLAGGIVDAFEAAGLKIFGPRKNAALLESSKSFAKDFMKKYHIPTADYQTFHDPLKAREYLNELSYPVVLKADGLAAGKGVLICGSKEEALSGIKEIMESGKFGEAGSCLVAEEFLTGHEVSVLAFTDGRTIRTMTSAQDHKRALDGDKGLNTGGMGTFSPSPFYTDEIAAQCESEIFRPTVAAMEREGRIFQGVLFFGLMLTEAGPRLLEYNARFGDPETQVVLPRMENDIVEVMEACVDGTLDGVDLKFADNAALCVILASGGYPVKYETGKEISGLGSFAGSDGCFCFQAGTKRDGGKIVTNGGRVLGVTAVAPSLSLARRKAYDAAKRVSFDGMYCRSDIGKDFAEP